MNTDGSLGFVQTAAVFALRCGVTSQGHARAIVLDLSEGEALEDSGLEMLASPHQWTCDHGIDLKSIVCSVLAPVPKRRSTLTAGLGKGCPAKFLFIATAADHLEGCNAQISVLFFAGRLFNLSLFCFFILFRFCFAGNGAADCHLVANMLVKLDASAA